jgi:hypothetical protein
MKNLIGYFFFYLISSMVVVGQLTSESSNREAATIRDFYSKSGARGWHYGMLLLQSKDGISNQTRKLISYDLAASAFAYYFLVVEEKVLSRDSSLEFQIRETMKIESMKTAFDDPLAWKSDVPRGLLDRKFDWQRRRDKIEYKKFIERFKEYFAQNAAK